jgi:hypothetical protein
LHKQGAFFMKPISTADLAVKTMLDKTGAFRK